MLKKNKGITLIALVITIIVIVILTAITINAVVGDNGIISESKQARDDYYSAENAEQETLDSAVSAIRRAREEAGIINNGSGSNNNGNNNNNNSQKINTAVNTSNYGRIVYNYTAADLIWRLFYEDSNNIYLISETKTGGYPLNNIKVCNYENNVFTPLDSSYVSGESVSQQGKDLMPLLGGATSSSVGTVSIGTNSNGTNLLTSSNTNPNIWGTAYLCDTTKWTTYKTGPASWAMGGPTAELFAASYNSVDSSPKLALTIENCGYADYSNNNWFSTSFKNGIYRLTTDGRWWIASPNRNQTDFVHGVYDTGGYLGWDSAGDGNSARPVVCISKSTGFTCQFEVPRTGAIGAPVNTDKYGREVTNYTAAGLKWRLFYEDSNNIYLISETQDGDYPLKTVQPCNYTNNTYSPKDASYVSGESVSQQGKDLMPLAGGATTSSAGTIAIGTNGYGTNLFSSSNTNPSIWATAYLCDTRANGPWAVYKTDKAAWAMGGPTMELFAVSYNSTHTNHQISLEIGRYGYQEETSSNWSSTENYGIYRLKSIGMWWTASPGEGGNGGIRGVDDESGHFVGSIVYGAASVRPVVCLQKINFTYELAPES